LAAALQLGEVLALSTLGIFPRDFVASTLLLGTAAFLFFRSLDGLGWTALPARLGHLALGIYVLHPALIRLAETIGRPATPLAFWLNVAAIFAAALGLSALLYSQPLLRLAITTRGSLP